MIKRSLAVWLFGLSAIGTAAAAAYLFLSAVATASLRFGYCGPTSLDAAEQYCRVGMRLLYISYAVGALALVLAVVAFWLFRRRRKGSNSSFKPKPLRGSA